MTKRPRNEKHVAAIELLTHYIKTLAEYAKMPWSADNDEEVAGIVDSIIDAARSDDD